MDNLGSDGAGEGTGGGIGSSTDVGNQASTQRAQQASQQTVLQTKLTLEMFRALVGIPHDSQEATLPRPGNHDQLGATQDTSRQNRTADVRNLPPIRTATIQPLPSRLPWFLRFLRLLQRHPLSEKYTTSLYYTLVREEESQWKLYYLYDILVYSCLVLQLMIASVLIILGALAGDHHLAVAILGAVTGIITGILSLIKGQGLPNRLLQYANSLRQVKERIEFMERELRANVREVTFQEVQNLWVAYETARDEEVTNRPDTWTHLAAPTNLKAINLMWSGSLPPILGPNGGTNLHTAPNPGN
jgi:hypothetical protein